jgi:hypothetical protein
MAENQTEGQEFVLVGSGYCYRDQDHVLVKHRRGDRVKLSPEQVDRLRAGQPGSSFQHEADVQEVETEQVAVANEATFPGEDGDQTSPVGTRNRTRPATVLPEAKDAPATREQTEDARGETSPAPTSSTRRTSK